MLYDVRPTNSGVLGRFAARARTADLTRMRRQAARALYWACAMFVVGPTAVARAQVVAGSAVYVRRDSDLTTVIAPRLHVAAPVREGTYVDLVYTADVWTSASIDIRTSASKAVTEQRDELRAGISQEWGGFTLAGAYRYSHEPDYESHGGSLTGSLRFADNCATIDLRLSATLDQVGRAGDPGFDRDLRTLGARVTFTQVLDTHTLMQAIYEPTSVSGYTSSPYRFVGIGSRGGLCDRSAFYCIPENNPSERLRHAIAVEFRRALGDAWAVGVSYRFYLDDWDLRSHTAAVELAWSTDKATSVTTRYRFYTQSAAGYYRTTYEPGGAGQFYTNDKELSAFNAHRIAVDLSHAFELDSTGHMLDVLLSVAPSIYIYANYPLLRRITALEVSLATVFKL